MSTWAIRIALVYLVYGTLIGALLLAGKVAVVPTWLWALRPAHVEALLFGFMLQLAFGVAAWILPRTPARPHMWPVGLSLVLLNAGVWQVAAAPILRIESLAVTGRACEAAAAIVFAFYIWPRVRGQALSTHEGEPGHPSQAVRE